MQSVFRTVESRERLAQGALSWLEANLDLFDPPQENLILDKNPESITAGRTRKAFGELGAVLRIAQRVPALRRKKEIVRLRDAWLKMAKTRNIFFDARRRIHLFPNSAVAFAVLKEFGEADEQVRKLLQNVLDRNFMDRIERSAWGKLDMKYYLDAAGLQHGFSDNPSLFAESSLRQPPALTYANSLDLYGITHLIFHFSDFGWQDIRSVVGDHLDNIRQYVSLALQICQYEQDFDLTAELLISLICLRHREDPLNWVAADALCRSQHRDGFIPDRSWLEEPEKFANSDESEREKFFAVYHPTIVALFLVSCDMNSLTENSI